MYLDDIFTGVTPWFAHNREQHFVDRLRVLRIADLPMIKSVRAKFTVAIVRPDKYSQRDFLRMGPLIRTTARPPSPGGVAIAAMVSPGT